MYNTIFLLGSNLGDRLETMTRAIDLLQEEIGELRRISSVYETAAWGKTDQNAFLNQVLEMETEFLPDRILHTIQEIEKKLGRVRLEKWGPRIIDIDILFHSNHIQENPELTIPHPQLHLRRFTLLPLAEILPDLQHPTLHKSIAELLEECPDKLPVHLFHYGRLE